jgi:O-antigen/teichoic acid export membrane protein
MPQPRTAALAILWNYTGKGLEYVVQYVTSLLIARALGVDGNGEYAGLLSISQLMLVLASFGLETSLMRHIPVIEDSGATQRARFLLRRFAALRTLLVLLVAVLAGTLLLMSPGQWPERVKIYGVALVIITVSRSISSLWAVVLTARLHTRTTGLVNLATRLFELGGVITVMALNPTVGAVLTVLVLSSVLQLAGYVLLPSLSVFGAAEGVPVAPILLFGGTFWLNTIVDFFLGRHGDIALLTVLLPNTGQASLYDVSFMIVQLGTLGLTIGFSGVSLALASGIARESVDRLDQFMMTLIRMVSLLTIPLYAFLFWNIPHILAVMYPSGFAGAAAVVQGMVAFRVAGRLFGGGENADYLLARGRVVPLVAIGVISAVLNVALNFMLIPSLGARGAMIASGTANLLVNVLAALLIMRRSTVTLQFSPWLALTALTFVTGLAVSMPDLGENLPGVIIRMAGYSLILIGGGMLVKPLTPRDTALLGKIDRRLATMASPFTGTRQGIGSQ